jgi:cell division septal protein FtsQ
MRRPNLHFWRLDGNRRVRLRRRRLSLARALGIGLVITVAGAAAAAGGHLLLRRTVADPDCRLEEVMVSGATRQGLADIERRIQPFLRQPLLELDLEQIRHALEEAPWVAAARVARVWPCRLRVEVRERVPVVVTLIDRQPWLAAADGTLLGVFGPGSPVLDLPVLTGLPPGPDARPEAIRRGVAALEAFAREAEDLASRISSLDLSHPERITVRLRETPWPLWLDVREPGRNLRTYTSLRHQLHRDGIPASVDLRWDGRIAVRPRTVEN